MMLATLALVALGLPVMAVTIFGVSRRSAGAANERGLARRSSRSVGLVAAGVAVLALVSGCGGDKDERLTTPAQAVTSGAPLPSGAEASPATSSSPASTTSTTSTSVSSSATGSTEDETVAEYTRAEQAEAVKVARRYFEALNAAVIDPPNKAALVREFYDSSCKTCLSAQRNIQEYVDEHKHVKGPRFSLSYISPDFAYQRTVVAALINQNPVQITHEDGTMLGKTASEKDVPVSVFLRRDGHSWKITAIKSRKGAV